MLCLPPFQITVYKIKSQLQIETPSSFFINNTHRETETETLMVTRSRNTTEQEQQQQIPSDFENGRNIETKRAKTESDYEQLREQRMKENMERMQKLGLLDLSLKLKTTPRPYHKPTITRNTQSLPLIQRRSSRIMSLPPVKYSSKVPKPRGLNKGEVKKKREVEIYIPEGTKPEVYTEKHEKLLGDCETAWELYVDGYDEDGDRIYDPNKGEKCHQCGHITVCEYTDCNKCELPQGMLCGDCLYTRYGENVKEAIINPKWTCPACRGICNCNSCRRKNGWMSTGNIYNKVIKLGFKSVAHYLIKTRRSEKSMEEVSGDENIVAQEKPETSAGTSPDTTLNGPTRPRTRRALRN